MGKLLSLIEKENVTNHLSFLKNYRSYEKLQLLKLLNQDYLIDIDTFCNFFLCTNKDFEFINIEDSGFVNILDIQMYLYLLKEDYPSSKITNILSMFNINDQDNISQSEFFLLLEIFLKSVQKIFDLQYDNQTYEEIYLFEKQVFMKENEVAFKSLKKVLEEQLFINKLLIIIPEKAVKIFGS